MPNVQKNKLEQLRDMSIIVADTGDIESIRQFMPTDGTTNPSLILRAATNPTYAHLVDEAVAWGRRQVGDRDAIIAATCDRVALNFGTELTKIVPGRVSTEVDADLSFNTALLLDKARCLIANYESRGIGRERVLIKLASTWEGIKAAEILEKERINCNLTLLFSFAQAVACAQAGVFLISPFVGRIFDWYVKSTGEHYTPDSDPGVLSVARIFKHYKSQGYETIVMGASFRNIGQIEALAGCDRLTIAPGLLEQLAEDTTGVLVRKLDANTVTQSGREGALTEATFRFEHNEDAMATEKLAEGIRLFAEDLNKLRAFIAMKIV
ncbi:transaldolase [Beijerinckia indica]|nr:transaldolase [Beijerinckia indica]